MGVKVAKSDYSIFGALGISEFVGFDFADGHRWEWVAQDVFHVLILGFSDIFPCLSGAVEANVFFKIGLIPDLFIIFGELVVVFGRCGRKNGFEIYSGDFVGGCNRDGVKEVASVFVVGKEINVVVRKEGDATC